MKYKHAFSRNILTKKKNELIDFDTSSPITDTHAAERMEGTKGVAHAGGYIDLNRSWPHNGATSKPQNTHGQSIPTNTIMQSMPSFRLIYQNKFAYKKKAQGGFYNNTVYLVKYQDLKIVEIEESAQPID